MAGNKILQKRCKSGYAVFLCAVPFNMLNISQNPYGFCAKMLLSSGADVDTKNNDGWTALGRAVFSGHPHAVEAGNQL